MHGHLMLDHEVVWMSWWCTHLVLLLLLLLMVQRMIPWHDILMMTTAHMMLLVMTSAISLILMTTMVTVWTLEIAPVVLIPLMHLEVATCSLDVVLMHHLAITLSLVMSRVEGMRSSLWIGHATLIDLEG